MSRLNLRSSVAALAIISTIGGAAFAQTTTTEEPAQTAPATDAPADAAPAAEAPAEGAPASEAPAAAGQSDAAAPAGPLTAETLPDLLKALNLTDLDIEEGRRGGSHVEGEMEDGTEIEAMVAADGTIRMVKTDDDKPLPQSVIDALLPEAVRSSTIIGELAVISGIGVKDDVVMIGGEDADDEDVRALFSADGTLIRFGRGDDDFDHGRRGERGGPDGHHHMRKGHGMEKHGDGPRGADMGRPGQPPLDEDVVRQSLGEAGYTDLGDLTRHGPHSTVEATNRAGEAVTLELNPMGQVIRETAR